MSYTSITRPVTDTETATALFGVGLGTAVYAALSGHFVRAVAAGGVAVLAARMFTDAVRGEQFACGGVWGVGVVPFHAADREEARACEE